MRSSQITLGKLNSLLARCSLIGQSAENPSIGGVGANPDSLPSKILNLASAIGYIV
jgi:hypothetical protein